MIKLFDDRGNESSFEINIYFFVPLEFSDSALPDLNVVAGKFASIELPEIYTEPGYSLQELIIQPEVEVLSGDIKYDP